MIKVNLLPVKRKRKPKPIPAFVVTMVVATIIVGLVMAYLAFFFNSRLETKKETFKDNEKKIAELKEKIKAVENFEQVNKLFQQKTSVIEQLRKNQSFPVKLLDEISKLLPNGVWLHTMTVAGGNINIDGYAFANSDVVSYVENLKNSKVFTEIYLQESKSLTIEKIPVYMFKLTFKMKV
ncbi:MAG: PilN domain-containing protein [Nitrospirota bacterium]|nr:PilN domain-containing protein [Nitrospirota bacterium]MDH5768956.1 PilN domain-containing protein [Nitrospirota bacterium]